MTAVTRRSIEHRPGDVVARSVPDFVVAHASSTVADAAHRGASCTGALVEWKLT
jgi:hypothetical protein